MLDWSFLTITGVLALDIHPVLNFVVLGPSASPTVYEAQKLRLGPCTAIRPPSYLVPSHILGRGISLRTEFGKIDQAHRIDDS